ncbi:DUF1109 domain-containing protein [Psychromarinibacter sp. C21-152]|uniref:DUF1109 domain-containing protein n=1 Tax=Psychromarinibacter sediminicola TaxID=3033385 RepID=A0AAE3T7B0_9RHOB|nr:DUF1109 domain-containing protein [Psychromarinibacter sediminicola]MDF0600127.1 DUF1109 domain-containing protein [Psychromarinibacter sediminicola]
MKTEELIAKLAAEPAPAPAASLERRAGLGVLAGGVVAIALFFAVLGLRPDLPAHMAEPVTLMKTVLPLGLAALLLPAVMHAARPGVPLGWTAWLAVAVPVAAVALFVWAFATAAPGERLTLFIGHSIPVCLPTIPVLAMPILAGLVYALRRGAPEHPRVCGALAGLAAGGLATTTYSLFCTEDSPLFYATWYSLAILVVAGLGAWAGKRYLRW